MQTNRSLCRFLLIGVMAGGALTACNREDSTESTAPPEPVAIEVLSTAGDLEAARTLHAQSQEEEIQRFLQYPDSLRYDTKGRELMIQHKDRTVPALRQQWTSADFPAAVRLKAGIALKTLNEPVSLVDLIIVARNDADATQHLLWTLYDLIPDAEISNVPAELKSLIVESLQNETTRAQAVSAAGRLKIAEAADPLLQIIQEGNDPNGQVLLSLSEIRPNADTLAMAVAQLQQPRKSDDQSWWLSCLMEHAKTGDPKLVIPAVDAAVNHLMVRQDEPWMDSGFLSAMETIDAYGGDRRSQLLNQLSLQAKSEMVRDQAKAAISEPPANSATDMPPTRTSGQPIDVAISEAKAILVKHQIITQEAADAAIAKFQSDPEYVGDESVESLLSAANLLVVFDTETGTVPVRHDQLLLDFADASAGVFRPEACTERFVSKDGGETGVYTVQFIYNNKVYRAHPNDLGDWYDVDAILKICNAALADAGEKRRFIPLETGDQTLVVVFGTQEALAELNMAATADPDASRRAGKEFEERVIQELESREPTIIQIK